jgi:Capsule polysaccharide biosynthesis protein
MNQNIDNQGTSSRIDALRVLIVSPYATVAPHFETELEIAERHFAANDEVTWLACTGALPNCDFNTSGSQNKCEECLLRRNHGYSMLSRRPQLLALRDCQPVDPEFSRIRNVEELKAYSFEGFDIGYAVLSSLVSAIRDPEPNLVEHRDLLDAFFQSAMSVFLTVRQFLETHPVDRVYVFNGRFATLRAVLRAAQQCDVDCQVHERGATLNKFELYDNHLPHDIDAIYRMINSSWNDESVDIQTKSDVGAKWFHDRRSRVETNWVSFTKIQQERQLPPDFDSKRRNIAIFPSSDDEFVAIGDSWRHTLYPTQVEGIKRICSELLRRNSEIHVYVRMHPNMISVENRAKQEMLRLSFPNLTVLAPEDTVDTYALLDSVEKVVTFGSSIGIEACYWQKNSILLGPCFYQDLAGPRRPRTHDEVITAILEDPTEISEIGALQYGYWMASHGIDFWYFEPESWYHGRFKGNVVYALKPKLTPLERAFSLLGVSKIPRSRAS